MGAPKFGRLSVQTVHTSYGRGLCHKIGPLPVSGLIWGDNYACIYADGIRIGIDESLPVAIELRAYAQLFAAAPELYESLKELSALYAHAWDRTDGSLVMMNDSIERFERAHEKAAAALAKADGQ